ncbi:Variable large protein 15/16 (plasmid) [Borrelia turicatae]|uniref:Variable large protein n=1 Tax=Borrelia turicatae TaxID=142 RepID=A0A172XDA4_BORTU|nr:variable large family protein [Borrelia turicatae]ANF34621.1 Variable large protein 15/16 [Borrelia turicatae]UPA15873.1 variable large family protein [Borrelia turicatae]
MKRITLSALLMTLFLLLSCGSGSSKAEDPQSRFLKSVISLSNDFLNVFTSLSDMVAGALGIKADTKKSDIGNYFTSIETTMNTVKKKLQDEVAKNGNYVKVKSVVDTFITNTLDKIAEGAKTAAIGATGDDKIGNAVKNQDAVPAKVDSVNALITGIGEIVGVVLKDNEGNPDATKTSDEEQKSIGKLFGKGANNDGTEAEAAAANASIGAVTGADILKAIASSEKAAGEPTIQAAKNSAEIATAKVEQGKTLDAVIKKDAIIAAGIALRAMAKDGKFTAKNGEDKSAHAVNGVAASAVGKTLSTLIIAIRNTVDTGLKTINKALATVTQEDKSAEAITPADAATGGQKQ